MGTFANCLTVALLAAGLFCAPVLGQPAFVDVSVEAGVAVEHRAVQDVAEMAVGTGLAWFDYDRDGDLDLYVTQGEGPNNLFENDGTGSFTDVAALLGADDADHAGAGVAVADYDNDGWPDIYLANADADVLLKNDGGLRFEDVSEQVGLADLTKERATHAAWGDYDADGYLDVYVVSHMNLRGLTYSSRDRLFHNDAGTGFTETTNLLSADLVNAYGFAATWTDYDRDGDADLLVVNDCLFGYESRYRPTVLYRNDGGSAFTEVSAEVGASHCRHGMGIATGDYNRDGWIDHFYTNIGKRTTLLTNMEGAFQDTADSAGVFVGYNPREPGGPIKGTYSWGSTFFDYDLDGLLDLYVAAGTLELTTDPADDPQPNVLFRNRGDGTFETVPDAGGASSIGRSRTTAVGDFDTDGDPDLALVDAGQRVYLFRNDAAAGGYLIVDLVGAESNRDGIGAVVRITLPDGSRQHVEIRIGSSLGATDDRAAYFGLGAFDRVDEMRVEWPSGAVRTLSDVSAGQRITVAETVDASIDPPPADVAPVFMVFPNPAADEVTLQLSGGSGVAEIVDVMGRRIRRISVRDGAARWDGTSEEGDRVGSGLYFIRLQRGPHTFSRSVVLTR